MSIVITATSGGLALGGYALAGPLLGLDDSIAELIFCALLALAAAFGIRHGFHDANGDRMSVTRCCILAVIYAALGAAAVLGSMVLGLFAIFAEDPPDLL